MFRFSIEANVILCYPGEVYKVKTLAFDVTSFDPDSLKNCAINCLVLDTKHFADSSFESVEEAQLRATICGFPDLPAISTANMSAISNLRFRVFPLTQANVEKKVKEILTDLDMFSKVEV